MRCAFVYLLAFAILAPLAARGQAELPFEAHTLDRIVAWIDDEPVTLSETEKALAEYQARGDIAQGNPDRANLRKALQMWIDEQLILRAADRAGLEVPSEVIDNQVDPMIERLEKREGGKAQLDVLLERTGETRQSLRERLRGQLRREWTVARFIQSRVTVTDAEVEAFVKERREKGLPVRRYHVAHFFIPVAAGSDEDDWKAAEEIAYQVRLAAAREGDFLEAALDYAHRYEREGAQAARLGALEPGEMDAAIAKAIEQTEPGHTTAPVRTERGVHVLYLERVTSAREILGALRFEKAKKELALELRNQATVRVIDPMLKSPANRS